MAKNKLSYNPKLIKQQQNDEVEFSLVNDPNDIIWVTEFNPSASSQFCANLLRESKKDLNRPIIIYINSPGGQVFDLLAMMACMDSVPNPKVTVGMGQAMSCGAVLLGHGDIRFAAPNCQIMVHEISAGAGGNIQDLNTEAQYLMQLHKLFTKIMAEDCEKSIEQVEALFTHQKRDVYLSPAKAKKFGLIDHVGVPRLVTATQYQLA